MSQTSAGSVNPVLLHCGIDPSPVIVLGSSKGGDPRNHDGEDEGEHNGILHGCGAAVIDQQSGQAGDVSTGAVHNTSSTRLPDADRARGIENIGHVANLVKSSQEFSAPPEFRNVSIWQRPSSMWEGVVAFAECSRNRCKPSDLAPRGLP